MTMPSPPPDTRAQGQAGHISDHNTIADDLAALAGAVAVLQAAIPAAGSLSPSQNIATGATIALAAGYASYPLTESANVTGIILPPGSYQGQWVRLVNTSAHTVTFAASGTSNVADGASDVIAALTAATYTWSGSLWYRG